MNTYAQWVVLISIVANLLFALARAGGVFTTDTQMGRFFEKYDATLAWLCAFGFFSMYMGTTT